MPGEKVHFYIYGVKVDSFPEKTFSNKKVYLDVLLSYIQYYSAEEYFTRIVGLPKVFWMLQIYCYLVMILQIFFFLRCYTIMIVACQNENEQALRRS